MQTAITSTQPQHRKHNTKQPATPRWHPPSTAHTHEHRHRMCVDVFSYILQFAFRGFPVHLPVRLHQHVSVVSATHRADIVWVHSFDLPRRCKDFILWVTLTGPLKRAKGQTIAGTALQEVLTSLCVVQWRISKGWGWGQSQSLRLPRGLRLPPSRQCGRSSWGWRRAGVTQQGAPCMQPMLDLGYPGSTQRTTLRLL